MITIKGTNKIKGALDLGGIHKQITTGISLPITDKEFTDYSVQMSIKMGLLTYEKDDYIETDSLIQVKNAYDRPLTINMIAGDIRPGQTFMLTEDQINTSDIRGALAKGYLEIVSSAKIKEIKETNVNIGKLFQEEINTLSETSKDSHLETNEEIVNPSVISSNNPEPIVKEDIKDPKGKTVIWNPNKDPIMQVASQMKAVTADSDRKVSSLTEKDIETDISFVDKEADKDKETDISFVDKEADKERRKSHPILKDIPEEENDGIDFL